MDIRELTAQVEHISQIYASRFRITRDDNWQILKLQEDKWLVLRDVSPRPTDVLPHEA